MVDVPPWVTVLPSLSTPLPSTAIACGTLDGVAMTIVTFPALVDSESTLNFSAPLGSALSASFEPPPDGAAAGAVACAFGLAVGVVSWLSDDPQPATSPAAASGTTTASNVLPIRALPFSSPSPVPAGPPDGGRRGASRGSARTRRGAP